tara:strand:- start:501 stop:1598 length:1098 start_codon:yes stop_codon:yes gene_type:complete
MKLFEISNYLDTRVPLALQEDYDNCGLLIGNKNTHINSILVSLDCTEEVVDEAINNNHNLIVSHHPLIFGNIKKITGSNYVEKIIAKAIKHDIAIYAMHTNLDNIYDGVSFQIADKINLEKTQILKPKPGLLMKMTTYCPPSHTDLVKNALFDNGAGRVGHLYDRCSFVSSGTGSFRPLDGANPFSGQAGKDSLCKEDKIEVVFYSYMKPRILSALKEAHPYQEVAYVFDNIQNASQIGSGVIGEFKKALSLNNFLAHIKKTMNTNIIKYNKIMPKKNIKKVAICGGSGRFLLEDAIINQADAFITSDFKYHDFFDTNNQIIVCDIGHYESEFHTQQLIYSILKENFSKLAVRLTSVCTNPILYY